MRTETGNGSLSISWRFVTDCHDRAWLESPSDNWETATPAAAPAAIDTSHDLEKIKAALINAENIYRKDRDTGKFKNNILNVCRTIHKERGLDLTLIDIDAMLADPDLSPATKSVLAKIKEQALGRAKSQPIWPMELSPSITSAALRSRTTRGRPRGFTPPRTPATAEGPPASPAGRMRPT